jgi:hypothetical protein
MPDKWFQVPDDMPQILTAQACYTIWKYFASRLEAFTVLAC